MGGQRQVRATGRAFFWQVKFLGSAASKPSHAQIAVANLQGGTTEHKFEELKKTLDPAINLHCRRHSEGLRSEW